LKGLGRGDPDKVAAVGKIAGGTLSLAGAAFLGARGQLGLAVPLGAVGLGLLGWLPWPAGLGARTRKSRGQVSRVRTASIEMELEDDSGAMHGGGLVRPYGGGSLVWVR